MADAAKAKTTKPKAAAAAKVEAKPKAAAAAKVEAKPQAVVATKVEAKPKPSHTSKVEAKPIPAAAPKVAAKPKTAAKRKASAKHKAVAAVKAAPKPASAPKAKPAPVVNPRAGRPKRAPGTPPAIDRAERKTRVGFVVSAKMEKTVVVKIERRVQHPLYGKVVLRTKHFKAHDVIGCDEGDRVEIMETRPISKQKRWRVTQILEKVK